MNTLCRKCKHFTSDVSYDMFNNDKFQELSSQFSDEYLIIAFTKHRYDS